MLSRSSMQERSAFSSPWRERALRQVLGELELADAKVDDLGDAVRVDDGVAGLEVAVHDVGVQVAQRACDVHGDGEHLREGDTVRNTE